MIPLGDVKADLDLDSTMEHSDSIGFCIHTERDVVLAGLRADLAEKSFRAAAEERGATHIIEQAEGMIPLIAFQAKKKAGTFVVNDGYTTR